MALSVHSKFYYGIRVTAGMKFLNFKEGAGSELTAELTVKGYTLEELALEIATQLNSVGSLIYTVTANRATRILTISASGNFTLLGSTGTNVALGAWAVIGFPAADSTSAASHAGTTAVGVVYSPQFILQNYLPKEKNRRALNAVVSKSASGRNVSVQSFGEERFIKFNIKYVTNREQPADHRWRSNSAAVEELLTFLEWASELEKFEFMENENEVENYSTAILESVNGNADPTSFELIEYWDRDLPDVFETGLMVLKVVD